MLCFNVFGQEVALERSFIHLTPYKDKELTNGDKSIIRIESKKSATELRKYISTQVINKFYILDYRENEDGKFYEVFVLNRVKDEKPKEDQMFSASEEFKFNFDKERIAKEFMILDSPYKEEVKTPIWYYLVLSLFIILLGLVFIKYIFIPQKKKMREKSYRKQKADILIKQLDSVSSREDFETIYKIRNDLIEFVDVDSTALKKFYEKLNQIQYKKSWSDEEKESLNKIFKTIGNAKLKNGI